MSKVFARYIVAGDSEDMQAFEAIVRHIDKCIMLGEGREIKVVVDGDGSASLNFYRSKENRELGENELDGYQRVEYLDYPKKVRNKLFEGKEDVELGEIGVMKANGDGEYSIGE